MAERDRSATHKKTHSVTVAGTQLHVKSENSPERVAEIVEFLNEKIKEALSSDPSPSLHKATLLAALNLAEQVMVLKQRTVGDLDHIEGMVANLMNQISEKSQATSVPS